MSSNSSGRARVVSISAGRHRADLLRRRDELIDLHLDLATQIARSVAASLPRSFDIDDLTQTARLGLLRAATRYDPARHGGTPFVAYARPVIRGAVLDSVRRGAWVENTRPSVAELPERGVSEDRELQLDLDRLAGTVRAAVDTLSKRHRRVITLHYNQDRQLRDVGRHLGVGKSRASQLHREALRSLRAELVAAR